MILPESLEGSGAPVGFINPGSLMDQLSSKRLSPADDVANDAQLLGRPKNLTTGQKGDPISDRKAWPKRNGARF